MTRRMLAGALHRASFFFGHALRSAKAQRVARILTYRGIGDHDISAESFDWQPGFLKDKFELLPLHEVMRRQQAGAVTGCEVAITFDDGVRNHVTEACPILQRHRALATFFVCPGLVDSGRWISSLNLRARLGLLNEEDRLSLRLETGAADHEVETLVDRAKRLDFSGRRRAEAWVQERIREFSPSPQQIARCTPVIWPTCFRSMLRSSPLAATRSPIRSCPTSRSRSSSRRSPAAGDFSSSAWAASSNCSAIRTATSTPAPT